jgi:hypothetical protein
MLEARRTRREREIGTQADEHAAPVSIVHVEVVLDHPAPDNLEKPAIVLFVPDGNQNSRRLPRFQDSDDLVRFSFSKVGLDEVAAPSLGGFQNVCTKGEALS